jgi:hypothetical protein
LSKRKRREGKKKEGREGGREEGRESFTLVSVINSSIFYFYWGEEVKIQVNFFSFLGLGKMYPILNGIKRCCQDNKISPYIY